MGVLRPLETLFLHPYTIVFLQIFSSAPLNFWLILTFGGRVDEKYDYGERYLRKFMYLKVEFNTRSDSTHEIYKVVNKSKIFQPYTHLYLNF